MPLEDALAIANAAMQTALGRQLSDMETLIFEGSWQGKTYPQIADEAGYSINYLTTDVGPKFWKILSQALGEPVNKKNFKAAIKREGESKRAREQVGEWAGRSVDRSQETRLHSSRPSTHPPYPSGSRYRVYHPPTHPPTPGAKPPTSANSTAGKKNRLF